MSKHVEENTGQREDDENMWLGVSVTFALE